MSSDSILNEVGKYYSRKIQEHGATPAGVDWNSAASQELRFDQLLRMVPPGEAFSINDYGCGYGALADYLRKHGYQFQYSGFEISEAMAAEARRLHPGADFRTSEETLPVHDYTVASGIFNVRLHFSDDVWRDYVCARLESLRGHSSKGFAFNILTSYSDVARRRADLYYADPLFFFDFCKRRFSSQVALFHDYPLYEFTIAVRV